MTQTTTGTMTAAAPRTLQAAVELRGVSRTYGSGTAAVRAVDRVDVDFPRGT